MFHFELQVGKTQKYYKEIRSRDMASDDSWFKLAESLCSEAGVELTMPRICSRMTSRSNAPSVSVKEYFYRNVYLPFLDHLLMELESQFTRK